MSVAALLGYASDAIADSESRACVSYNVFCDIEEGPETASKTPPAKINPLGSEVRASSRASASGVGAQSYVFTENGMESTVVGGASASHSATQISVGAPGVSLAILQWELRLTGTFAGGDSGPPCEHCGGESPWTSSGEVDVVANAESAHGKDQAFVGETWHSNPNPGGVVQSQRVDTMVLTVTPGDIFGWNKLITTRVVAENDPCTSGAGTCGLPGGAVLDANFRSTAVFTNFRLFDFDSGEEIFDFTLIDNEGTDYLAIDRGCGNGVIDEGESCDDFNFRGGDCCSASCQAEPPGCQVGNCGDANDDGAHDAVDALIALRTGVGIEQCPTCRCDADDNESISVSDALAILRKAVGHSVRLDCHTC